MPIVATMKMKKILFAVSEFLWPTYQPERHYMRGPGPACARKMKIRIA
ncbi:hypothetical protein [Aurantimonas sp. VKM B-3413]|nr:hypothetical protein [Aurantimonas sp. VKM B-3413]MCB8837602.1 hypothetical protein [Aurantimonas sp. VKM B-3413]